MTAAIIDGKQLAQKLRAVWKLRADRLNALGIAPGLAAVVIGDNPASKIYVRNKIRACREIGIRSEEHALDGDCPQETVLALIDRLNADAGIHGILVQLPLPKSLHTETVINAIDPAKDVDGLHPHNAGRLAGGLAALSPCTPLGCIILTKSVHASLEGMNAIVIGRSNLVGRPLVQLLLNENATVTIAHSRSRDLKQLCARADLVYAAVGKPEMVRGDWIKPGATVIDVGINRMPGADGKDRLVGDVAFAEALNVAGAITPVPGGVGQMTVACLLVNTLRAACAIHGLPKPAV